MNTVVNFRFPGRERNFLASLGTASFSGMAHLVKLVSLFDVHVTVHRYCILLSTTSRMQRYKIFFITVNALHVSGGFSAHHQELKNR